MTDRRTVVVITGAASGIGLHWARTLANLDGDYRLALADVDAAGLAEHFREGDHLLCRGMDVRDPAEWRALRDIVMDRFGRVDQLFNIAGGGTPGFLLDVDAELVDRTIDTNLKGTIHGMRVIGREMVRQGSGHIVNVASLAGISSTPGNELYSAAKFGVRSISLSTAVRLRPKGVHVTVVCPDLVDTPTLMRHLHADPDDVALIHSGPRPLGVEDVADAFRRAIRDQPLEITVPRTRGWLAKLNNLFPPLMFLFYEPLMRKGRRQLEVRRRERLGPASADAPGSGSTR